MQPARYNYLPIINFLVHYFSGVVVGLQQTTFSIEEGNGSLSMCALLIGTAERDVVVSLSAISQTAQGKVYNSVHRYWCPF